MTPRETLERAAARGQRVRLILGGETLTGRPCVIVDGRVLLFAPDPGKVPTRALFIRAISAVEVIR